MEKTKKSVSQRTDGTKQSTASKKAPVVQPQVKGYYEAESWQFSGCGD